MDPPREPPDIDNPFPWPFDPAFTFGSTYNLVPDATHQQQQQQPPMADVQQLTMNPQLMNQQYGWQGFEGMWAQGVSGFGMWDAGMGAVLHAPQQEAAPSVLQHQTSFTPAVNPPATTGTGAGKPPPQGVVFGKRAWVSLKTFENGETRIQRRVIRYGLQIVQQPIQGKTFSEKDRRAIVHPPIVRLWLVESSPVNPEYAASYGEPALEDDSAWRDTVVDVSTVDTSGYTCIADALHAPDEGIIPTAIEESTDDPNALLPSGYKLCNVVPVTTTPSSTTEPRTLASLMASPDTIPPDAAARRASTASKAEGGSGSRRPSTRGAGKAGLETSDSMTGEASGSSADTGIAVAPSRTDSIVSNALALGPESSPHTSSAPSKSSSSGSTPPDPAPISKRNLMGNWAVGCRKMYGMGTPDDLGIWFVFTDVSIQQPGKYALRFRCFNLQDAQVPISETPPILPPPPMDELSAQEAGGVDAEREGVAGAPVNTDSKQSQGFKPKEENVTPPSRTSIATTLVEGTPTTPAEKVKSEARPLCDVQSADFTVYGVKGMPPWPHTSEMTSYFIRCSRGTQGEQ